MPIYPHKGRLKSTPRARGGPLEVTSQPPAVSPIGPSPAELRPYRIARSEYCAEVERRARKVGSTNLVRLARKRMHGAAKPLAATPEGRALLQEENAILDDASPAYRLLARAVDDFRPVIVEAVDAYAIMVRELGYDSATARRWLMKAATWEAFELFLLGKGVEMGAQTLGGTRSTSDGKVNASIAVLGFDKATTLAALCSAKSQYAREEAARINSEFRLEESQRARARRMRQVLQSNTTTTPAPTPALGQGTTSTVIVVTDGAKDDAEVSRLTLGEEEHGASGGGPTLSTPPPLADDLPTAPVRRDPGASSTRRETTAQHPEEQTTAELEAFIADRVWCSVRNRWAPSALAGKQRPNGPGYRQKWDAEDAMLDDWSRRISVVNRILKARKQP